MEKGGHVFFSITTENQNVNCAVYKQTGLGKTALNLIKGDKVQVGGGLRKASKIHPRTLNLEFIDVIDLKNNITQTNPFCKKCNKKMKSKGKNQGFMCIKCKKTSKSKTRIKIPRKIKKQVYIPEVSAHRHLTRPKLRMGKINKVTKFDGSSAWFSVYKN